MTHVASGDSTTAADLLPRTAQADRLSETVGDAFPHTLAMGDRVRRLAEALDELHGRIDMLHVPFFPDHAPKDPDDPARPPGTDGPSTGTPPTCRSCRASPGNPVLRNVP